MQDIKREENIVSKSLYATGVKRITALDPSLLLHVILFHQNNAFNINAVFLDFHKIPLD